MKIIKRDNRGLSLIELIIVIMIMVILVGIVSPMFFKYIKHSKKAKDIVTAERIATSAYVAFADNTDAFDAYQKWNSTGVLYEVSATVDGLTETYPVYLVVANEGPSYCFRGGVSQFGRSDGSTGFYRSLNDAMGLTVGSSAAVGKKNARIMPKYTDAKEGSGIRRPNGNMEPFAKLDRWRICKRKDTGQLEVWVAQPNPAGGGPVYRLYPNPDDEYTRRD